MHDPFLLPSYAYRTLVSYAPGPWSVSAGTVAGTAFVMWGRSSGKGQHWTLSDYPHPDPGDLVGVDGLWGWDRDGLWFPVWLPAGVGLIVPTAWWGGRRERKLRGFEMAAADRV